MLKTWGRGRLKQFDSALWTLRTEIHKPFIHTVRIQILSNFFSICRKRFEKILIYDLNITLKTGIFTSWNSRKLGHPEFWRFGKSKIGTILTKPGRLADMLKGGAAYQKGKTSFEKNCFSAWVSMLNNNYGFDQQRLIWYVFRLWDMVFSWRFEH